MDAHQYADEFTRFVCVCVFMSCSGFRCPLAHTFSVMFIFDDDGADSFKNDAQCLPETIMSER